MNNYFATLTDSDGNSFGDYTAKENVDVSFRFHVTTPVQTLLAEYAKTLTKILGKSPIRKRNAYICSLPEHAELSVLIFLRSNLSFHRISEGCGKAHTILRKELERAGILFNDVSAAELSHILVHTGRGNADRPVRRVEPKIVQITRRDENIKNSKSSFDKLMEELETRVVGDPSRPNKATSVQPFFLPNDEEASKFNSVDLFNMKYFVSLEDKTDKHCCYPIGSQQGREYYCGKHVHTFTRASSGKLEIRLTPYCEHHLNKVYNKVPRRFGGVGSKPPTERAKYRRVYSDA